MTGIFKITPEDAKRMRDMRAGNATLIEIARAIGCAESTVRRHLDPHVAERNRRGNADRYRLEKEHQNNASHKLTRENVERLRALIPADRRDTTGRAFGDPVFERSALYKKMQESA